MQQAEIAAGLDGLPGWTLSEGGDEIHRRYKLPDFAAAFALTGRIAALAEEADHHPDLELGWGYVNVRLTTHDTGGVSPKDFALAGRIEQAAG